MAGGWLGSDTVQPSGGGRVTAIGQEQSPETLSPPAPNLPFQPATLATTVEPYVDACSAFAKGSAIQYSVKKSISSLFDTLFEFFTDLFHHRWGIAGAKAHHLDYCKAHVAEVN